MSNPAPTSGQVTNGLDWADGLAGRVGTLTPTPAVTTRSSAGDDLIPIEEEPGSPELERGEQATIVHRFSMSWAEAQTQILFYGRGTFMVDSAGNVSRVLNAKITRLRGGPDPNKTLARLEITAESISFDTPPDDFSITEVELGVNIIKYPRYFYAFNPTSLLDNQWQTSTLLNQDVIRAMQNYFEVTTSAYRDALTLQIQLSIGHPGTISVVNGIPVVVPDASFSYTMQDTNKITVNPIAGTDLAKKAALEIIQKYWKNEETPYVVGYEMEWSVYYYLPQYLNPGGYTEDPLYQSTPQVPLYFWSPDWTGNTTIFDFLAQVNPQCYSDTGLSSNGTAVISWLRKADRCAYQRTWFKVTRRWIGSPVGFWDPDLYNSRNAPWAINSDTVYEQVSTPYVNKQAVVAAAIPTMVAQ